MQFFIKFIIISIIPFLGMMLPDKFLKRYFWILIITYFVIIGIIFI